MKTTDKEAKVTTNPDGSKTIPLSKSYTLGGEQRGFLTMREPLVEDQLAMAEVEGSDAKKELHLVANLCMVAPAELGKLTARDYRKVQGELVAFTV